MIDASRILAKIGLLKEQRHREITDRWRTQKQIQEVTKAIHLCTKIVEAQTNIVTELEALVNSFLDALFPEEGLVFFFEEQVNAKGDITGLQPMFLKDGVKVLIRSQGGGVNNVTSFALRLGMLTFAAQVKDMDPLMIMDEKLVNMDTNRLQKLFDLLDDFTKKTGVQIGAILHPDIELPQQIELYRSGSITRANVINNE